MSEGVEFDARDLEARWANAWRPEEITRRLTGVRTPWCVAAGWALDLFRGEQTRPHCDLETAVPASGFAEIRDRFPGFAFDVASSGRVWFDARADVPATTHQTWLRDPASGGWLCDVFREPHDGGVCSRGGWTGCTPAIPGWTWSKPVARSCVCNSRELTLPRT